MILRFFSSLTNQLFTGALLLALAFAGVQTWRLSSAKADLETKRNALAAETVKHGITLASLGQLEKRLADMIEAGKVTKANVANAIAETKETTDAIRAEADDIRVVVGTECKTPAEVMEGGL